MGDMSYTPNPQDAEEGFPLVPAGDYVVVIEDSAVKRNSKDTGDILNLTCQIVEGPYKGQKLFETINFKHNDSRTENMGKKTLNAISVAIGNEGRPIEDSQILRNIKFKAEVGIDEQPGYNTKNKILKHLPLEGDGVTTPVTTGAQPTPAGDKAAEDKQPWD